jgi:hypothetical protein
VRKILCFWQKHSPNCVFLVLHSPSNISTYKKHMTGGSSVRGKAGPNWVRKVSIVFAPYSIDINKRCCFFLCVYLNVTLFLLISVKLPNIYFR